jgi:hypothetical protein
MLETELLTTREAAELLGVDPRAILGRIYRGGFRHVIKKGHVWLIPIGDMKGVERKRSGYPKGRPRKRLATT